MLLVALLVAPSLDARARPVVPLSAPLRTVLEAFGKEIDGNLSLPKAMQRLFSSSAYASLETYRKRIANHFDLRGLASGWEGAGRDSCGNNIATSVRRQFDRVISVCSLERIALVEKKSLYLES